MDPYSLHQKQTAEQRQVPMMTQRMQKALALLQLPTDELHIFLEAEVTVNPLLEFLDAPESPGEGEVEHPLSPEEELDFSDDTFVVLEDADEEYDDFFSQLDLTYDQEPNTSREDRIPFRETLYEHLVKQAFEFWSEDEAAFTAAEIVLGYVNEKGLLPTPLQEIAEENSLPLSLVEEVYETICTFDPPGVAAHTIRDTLLHQLRQLGKQQSVAYTIIDFHYPLLLKNKIPQLQKALALPMEEILEAIEEDIATLDLHPGYAYSHPPTPPLLPDLLIEEDVNGLVTLRTPPEANPLIALHSEYVALFSTPELHNYVKKKQSDAQWLIHSIAQRRLLLERIGHALLAANPTFFTDPHSTLAPLTQKELATTLGVHPSTISRAIARKTVETPRGLFPLSHFFTQSYTNREGDTTSAQAIQTALLEIMKEEDPKHPFSDAKLVEELSDRGFTCSRRTVAKYRTRLSIPNTHQRKKF